MIHYVVYYFCTIHIYLFETLHGETLLKLDPSNTATTNSPLCALIKGVPVPPQLVGSFLVEGVVGVGLQEQVLKAVDDGVNGQDRFPVFAQNVETHVALQIDVGVVDCVQTLHFWWRVGVVFANFKLKGESGKKGMNVSWFFL